MKKISFLILLSLLIFACKDPYLDSVYTDEIGNFPASTFMENDTTMEVSLWVDLLKHADMFNTLNLQANYTCFVPDNQAMQQLLTAKGLSSVADMNTDDAKLLVRYHTIQGTQYSSVDFTEGLIPDSTASGDYLTTAFLLEGGQLQVNEEALVTRTVKVTNAYLHLIDKVLTPVTETIWEKLAADEFSIFREAFVLTGFNERLNTIETTETTSNNETVVRKYRYTLFAVPNTVFIDQGINTVNDLVDSLAAGNDYTVESNKLYRFMAYHLLNQQYSFTELSYFAETDKTRSKNYNTMAKNQLINVSEKDKTIFINWDKTNLTGVGLLKLNQNCKNGVIHTIDGLMEVVSPAPTKVRWELTDYPELSYISFYRKSSSSSTQQRLINSGDVTCYNWLSVPESKVGLTYELSNKNDAVKKKALNADYLILSLGTFGWVEMETPTIIAGKYAVYLEHFNPKGTEQGSKLLFILNGSYFGNQVSTSGANKTTDQYLTNSKIGEVTFTETTTHKVRILAGDDGAAYLDCITFSPM